MAKKIIKMCSSIAVFALAFLCFQQDTFAITILADGQLCVEDAPAGGCMCLASNIANGATCTFWAPWGGSDWVKTVITYGTMCTDLDGCTTTAFNIFQSAAVLHNFAQGQVSLADGGFTILPTNGQCTDLDGCMCNGVPLDNGMMCTTFIIPDTTAPVLVAWAVTNTSTFTPSFTFTSTEAWTITYVWACTSATTVAVTWANTITFTALATWTYATCTLKVTDASSNASVSLAIPSFTIPTPVVVVIIPPVWGWGGWWGGWGGGALIISNTGTTLTWIHITWSIQIWSMFSGTLIWGILAVQSNTGITKTNQFTVKTLTIKIIVPKFKNRIIRSAVTKLTTRVTGLTKNKLTFLSNSDTVTLQNVLSLVNSYNDFLAVLYLIVDIKRTDLWTAGKDYFTNFLTNMGKVQ